MTTRTLGFFTLAAVLCACGGETPPPATPAPTSTAPSGAAATAPGPGDWDKWSHEQKLQWMKVGVMPKMKQVFQAFDAAKYGSIGCATCHGAGAKDGTFKMPNPDLPKLPANPADFPAFTAKHPQMSEFMMKQVTPTMAGLVGEPEYDPKTGQGFGCMECHTKQ